ncbi:hypothetical protein [Lachnospira sp.]|jgi:hypothetical protein|nr:hypothetical protein [Lachnospira sp.]
MNWDEFLSSNTEEAAALRKALETGTGKDVINLVSRVGLFG